MRWNILDLVPEASWANYKPGQGEPPMIHLKLTELDPPGGDFHVLSGIATSDMPAGGGPAKDSKATWSRVSVSSPSVVPVRVFPLQIPVMSGPAFIAGIQLVSEFLRTLKTNKPAATGYIFISAAAGQPTERPVSRIWLGLALREPA